MPPADDENSNSWRHSAKSAEILCRAFTSTGDEVVVLTRKAIPG